MNYKKFELIKKHIINILFVIEHKTLIIECLFFKITLDLCQ